MPPELEAVKAAYLFRFAQYVEWLKEKETPDHPPVYMHKEVEYPLDVDKLGLKIIVVNGTSHDDLTKGPGRELHTYMPGEGELVYVAGHRTTYLAPFAPIDSLRADDRVTFELPYASFQYLITGHRVVAADDLAVLQSHHKELLELQACHPRFFASHRWIAYARLVRVTPRNGEPYSLAAPGPIT